MTIELPIPTRRSFLGGLIALVAAPAIVRVSSIMPIKAIETDYVWVAREVLKAALGDLDLRYVQNFGSMFMLANADADRLIVKQLEPAEVYQAGLSEWRFPRMVKLSGFGDYVEPPTSWE